MTVHQMVSESKSLCGRQVTQGTGSECGNCARVAKSREITARLDAMEARETAAREQYRAEVAVEYDAPEPCFHCGRLDARRRDDIVIPFPHECVGRSDLVRWGLLPEVTDDAPDCRCDRIIARGPRAVFRTCPCGIVYPPMRRGKFKSTRAIRARRGGAQ